MVVLPRAINRNEWLHYYEWSVKQWGAIQPPAFATAGTGSNSTTSPTPDYPANVSGQQFWMQVTTLGLTSAPSTPAGWSLIYGPDTTGTIRQYVYSRDARATGSDSGTVTVTIAAGNSTNMARIYAISGVTASVTSNGYAENETTTASTDGTCPGPTVAPKGYGRLAVAFVSVNDDSGMGVITGATGGTWGEAVAEHTSGLGAGMQLQIARLPNPAPISGGTATVGQAGRNVICRAFALVGL